VIFLAGRDGAGSEDLFAALHCPRQRLGDRILPAARMPMSRTSAPSRLRSAVRSTRFEV
jgi:hypothetical protein